jgi:hypothetical protein
MRDVDGRQVLAMGGDPVGEVACLAGGQQSIDKDGILLTRDERG